MKISMIIRCALFAALTAVLTFITIPIPGGGVPITLQTLAVALTGYVLGVVPALISVLIYVLLGIVGLPVFSGFQAGAGVLLGLTGGFIWGFFPMAALCGYKSDSKKGIFFGILGLVACHILGVTWFSVFTHKTIMTSFMAASLPFLLKDVLSVLCAYALAKAIKKRIKI